jgi:hypothetical protein
MAKLCEVISTEKTIKPDVCSKITILHRENQKADRFNGFTKTYRTIKDDGETFPPEQKRVQRTVNDALIELQKVLIPLFDVTATKDYANCLASADIVVDGEIIAKGCPPPYLLFVEKQLHDIDTYLKNLPELDDEFDWKYDDTTGLHRTNVFTTHKTKKVQRPLVLIPPTKEHQGKAEIITSDETVGYWDTHKISGAISTTKKKAMLEKVKSLLIGVKIAREQANAQLVTKQEIGEKIFHYLFS